MSRYKLIDEIIKLSQSKLWDIAKTEWDFDSIYVSDAPQTCLCGHYPIINICIIKNQIGRAHV